MKKKKKKKRKIKQKAHKALVVRWVSHFEKLDSVWE